MPIVLFYQAALLVFGLLAVGVVVTHPGVREAGARAAAEALKNLGYLVGSLAILQELIKRNKDKGRKSCTCPPLAACDGEQIKISRSNNGLPYQLYIANLKAAPLVFAATPAAFNPNIKKTSSRFEVIEWRFDGAEFDGFWQNHCTLVEAKDDYSFLDKPFAQKLKKGREQQLAAWAEDGILTDGQMMRHIKIAKEHQAVRVEWHFADWQFEKAWRESTDKDIVKARAAAVPAGMTVHNTANPWR